jgi:hypothetical protein
MVRGDWFPTRFTALVSALFAVLAVQTPNARAGDEPSLDTVLKRVAAYVASYGPQFANIVAEERYSQWIETEPGTVMVPSLGRTRREIKSDFVLTLLGDGDTWVAFRDAFEVDGSPVRDRDDRLVDLLSRGGDQAWRQASALANESARFNIGTRLIARNINVPTFVIQLMQDRNRERFRFSRVKFSDGRDRSSSGDKAPSAVRDQGSRRWAIEYRERERPTLVRQVTGGDQPLRGTMIVDSETGEVLETSLTWERGPKGIIAVTFAHVPEVDLLVPMRMSEQYRDARTTILGEAVYSRFRRFTTSARVITGPTDPR